LRDFLRRKPADVPISVIAMASNLLIRDGGVDGVVIRLGREISEITASGSEIVAGAGAADINVARRARDEGIAGLEFLAGIPGAVGGAISMNAGAYGREMKDIVISVEAVSEAGEVRDLSAADLQFGYRNCGAGDWVFTAARLAGAPGDKAVIAERMVEIQTEREQTQPVKTPTGGSTFANPPGAKAWKLIDDAGCRGLSRGGAMVSDKHCNFLINTGGATAADLEGLGEEVRRRVKAEAGVTLEWEIRRIGNAARCGPEEVSL
jgi:UDP-N-acetylmuramate dehydrogenase